MSVGAKMIDSYGKSIQNIHSHYKLSHILCLVRNENQVKFIYSGCVAEQDINITFLIQIAFDGTRYYCAIR